MRNARTLQTIIPKVWQDGQFYWIAEKVWNGTHWVKIDYYSLACIFILETQPVNMRDNISFKITIDNNLIA